VKVGDIVRQNHSLLEIRKGTALQRHSMITGVVVEIRNQSSPKENETEFLRGWMDRLGRLVDVLWANGRLSKNFAENSLDVVSTKEESPS